ncbi:MAG: septum site-determining protein MinC [Clostridia bacterium]|nr:septum site-determining protein MinC [Clostridia bacterium]
MKKEVVNIKGTRYGLAIVLDTSCDYEELKNTLAEKIQTGGEFFKGAKFALQPSTETLDIGQTKELEDICCQYGLIPSGEIKPVVHRDKKLVLNKDSLTSYFTPMSARPVKRSSSLPTVGLTAKEAMEPGLTVKHSLRSGQKIHYSGNVIIMGDVNAGAEVIATGSIIVMGTLRGIAHAGAAGDQESFIMAYNLRPTQLRIANLIGRAPDNDSVDEINFNPEVARIGNGSIMVDNYGRGKPSAARRSS